MRSLATALLAAIQSAIIGTVICADARAQSELRRISLKNSESVDLHTVYWVASCHSIMIGLPEVEVREGPSEVALNIRAEPVLPRRQGCAGKVPGGTLVLSAKAVTESKDAKLTYRLKYKTRDGDRQTSNAYIVSLFP